MTAKSLFNRAIAATITVALTAGGPIAGVAQAQQARPKARVASLPAGTQRPTREVLLSVGEGELITLPTNVTNVWTSNPGVADVYVDNPRQIYLFGKEFGEATVFATTAGGGVVYSTNVRVSQNITSIDKMMKLAMPEADIKVTTAGQIAVLTGTVASPSESAQAQSLALALLNPGVNVNSADAQLKIGVVNRLRLATPLQVNLQVRIAEVSRTFVKNIGSNLLARDSTSGFQFGLASGRNPGSFTAADLAKYPTATIPLPGGGAITGPYDPSTGKFLNPTGSTLADITKGAERSTIGMAGKLLGLDLLSALDLGETNGQVTTLAQPNLTALSGETSTFLAGGEIPIPISQGLGTISVEYKQYGVSLAYTPTVLSDGRISLRVRPEVSQLSAAGAVTISGVTIPALTTRRAETTVELGSGESIMIGGLLSNSHDNAFDKTPGVADLPVLGALFRSNAFKRNESELVIVVTPYLVKPVNANQIALPTDGYQAPNDFSRIFMGQMNGSQSGKTDRPKPSMAVPTENAPTIGALGPVQPGPQNAPAPVQLPQQAVVSQPPAPQPKKVQKKSVASAAPGFGL